MGLKSGPTLGTGMPIDVGKLIESRMLIQANSGGGKSWAIRRLLEQTYRYVPQIVIDVEGEFHTLREKFDYILAGQKGGDCPADVKSAAMLARRILELGVSAIVDIYELGAARPMFVKLFLESLVNAPRELWHPLIVVVDEAHMFCPEKDQSVSTGAVIDLMTRGRKRGFCGVLATQRIASVAKSAAAECNNKLIGRSSLDIDMKRAGAELGFTARADLQRIRGLPAGQFFAFGPALCDHVMSFKVGSVATTHPKAGQRAMPPTPPSSHVKKVLAKLADLPRQAADEARTVDELRARVRDLERDPKRVPEPKTLRVEVPILESKFVDRLEKVVDRLLGGMKDEARSIDKILTPLRQVMPPSSTPYAQKAPWPTSAPRHVAPSSASSPAALQALNDGAKAHAKIRSTAKSLGVAIEGGMSRMERAILTTLAQHPDGLGKARVLAQTGYSANGATSSAFAKLVREGWAISGPGSGALMITDAGIEALGPFDPLPVGEALQRSLLAGNQLSTMEKLILSNACAAYPSMIAKREAQGDYSSNGATSSAFARLVKLGYLEKSGAGAIRAVSFLFGDA